jgi:hypothetical protein
MREELGNDTEAISLVTVDSLVVRPEGVFEELTPHPVELAEPLPNLTIEFFVRPLLTGTFHDHSYQFVFKSLGKVDLHKFVNALFEPATALDGEVNGPPQTAQISIGLIFDFHCLLFFVLLILRRCIRVFVFVASLGSSKDFSFQLAVCLLIHLILWVELEHIEHVFHLEVIIKTWPVGDLIFLFHKIKLLFDGGVVLVLVLPDLEKYFNHVLCPLVDVRLVEDVAELVENGIGDSPVHLL